MQAGSKVYDVPEEATQSRDSVLAAHLLLVPLAHGMACVGKFEEDSCGVGRLALSSIASELLTSCVSYRIHDRCMPAQGPALRCRLQKIIIQAGPEQDIASCVPVRFGRRLSEPDSAAHNPSQGLSHLIPHTRQTQPTAESGRIRSYRRRLKTTF